MAYVDLTSLRPLGDIPPISTNTPVPVSSSDPHWHPKITAYRLLVISTTISLGSTKAIATFFGKSYVSITIEWIAGVLVFIFLFVAGWFEDNPSDYPKFAWFFDSDLIRLVWSPRYSSEERQRSDGPYPRITGYRLLVSCSVFLFGMVKASLSYAGLGGAANVLDWILGVVITSTLYMVGLYENNPMNIMPYLFERHYNDQFYSGRSFFSDILLNLIWLAFAIGLSLVWSIGLQEFKQVDFLAPSSFSALHDMIPTFMLRRFVLLCLIVGIRYSLFLLASIGVSLYSLWENLSELGLLPPFHELTALLRHVVLWIPKIILRQFGDFNTPTWAEGTVDLATKFYWFARRFGVHILIFTAATNQCAILAFYGLGFLVPIFSKREGKDTTISEYLGHILVMIFYAFIVFFMGIGGCISAGLSIRRVLRPFSQDLEDLDQQILVFAWTELQN